MFGFFSRRIVRSSAIDCFWTQIAWLRLQFLQIGRFQSQRVIFAIVKITNCTSARNTHRLSLFWRVFCLFKTNCSRCWCRCWKSSCAWRLFLRNRLAFEKYWFVKWISFFCGFHLLDSSDQVSLWGVICFRLLIIDSTWARITLCCTDLVRYLGSFFSPKTDSLCRGCCLKLGPIICETHSCLEIGLQ